jgi:hypothetical protein
MDSLKGLFSKPKYNHQLSKVSLKLALNRIRLQRNKKSNLNDVMKREAALLLSDGKEPSAFVKVENMIREERIIEVYNLLEIHIEHLLLRIDSIPLSTIGPPPDVLEPLSTVIYASPRIDIKELKQINQNWVLKYGNAFVSDAMSNRRNVVNEQVLEKLSFYKPPKYVIYKILVAVAKQYNVKWSPPDDYVEEVLEVKSGLEPSEEQLLSELEKFSKSKPLKKQSNSSPKKDNTKKNEDEVEEVEEVEENDDEDIEIDLSILPSVNNFSQNKKSTESENFFETNTTDIYNDDIPSVPDFAGFDEDEDELQLPDIPLSNTTPPPVSRSLDDLDLPEVPKTNEDLDLPDVPILHSQITIVKKDTNDNSLNLPKQKTVKKKEDNSLPNFEELSQRLNKLKK